MLVKININGKKKSVDIEPKEYLVDTLRKVGNLSVDVYKRQQQELSQVEELDGQQ